MKEYNTLTQIRQDIATGNLSLKDLVAGYLQNIEAKKHLNAFLEVFADEARASAADIDAKIKAGTGGRLAGMVIGLKDNICYKGHHLSASSRILEGFTSLYSSTVVERLLQEDAIIIGRLNCDEFAMGASNENSAFGPVLNDADNSRVSGGSSGGAAVAVQGNLCHAAFGSDTGGSIRQPAAFCGQYGLKPTYGRVSRWGLIAYASSFDQIGPITKSLSDQKLLLEIIAGADAFDATCSPAETEPYSQIRYEKAKYRVAYIKECLDHEGIDPEVRDMTLKAIQKLRNEGHVVQEISFPLLDCLVPVYYVLTTAEASSNLSRFSGLTHGYRSRNIKDLDSTFKRSRSEGFGPEVKRRIMLGTFVLSAGFYDAYYSKAQKVRAKVKNLTDALMKDYDFILTPTTPTPAFKFGEKSSNPIAMYLADIFTVHANITGNPALSIPYATHSNGLPMGLQLMGRHFEEGRLLDFAGDVKQ